jgi:hypothetical protein
VSWTNIACSPLEIAGQSHIEWRIASILRTVGRLILAYATGLFSSLFIERTKEIGERLQNGVRVLEAVPFSMIEDIRRAVHGPSRLRR